jgi:predicted amidohydrolase YtcJ
VPSKRGVGKNQHGWYPDQKISVADALKAYTASNAYASFMNGKTGVLKAGAYADFAVLDKDLREIDPVQIRGVKVLSTVLNGKEVFKRKQ